jgi:hypothetical protein
MECIEVLRVVLTPDEFRGFCLGNVIKYRWRRKLKGNAEQDERKASWYEAELGKSREFSSLAWGRYGDCTT